MESWSLQEFEKQIAEAKAKIKEVDSNNEDNKISEDILPRKEGFSEL